MKRQRETPEGVAALYRQIIRAQNNNLPQERIDAMRAEHDKRRKRLIRQESRAAVSYHIPKVDRRSETEAKIRGTA